MGTTPSVPALTVHARGRAEPWPCHQMSCVRARGRGSLQSQHLSLLESVWPADTRTRLTCSPVLVTVVSLATYPKSLYPTKSSMPSEVTDEATTPPWAATSEWGARFGAPADVVLPTLPSGGHVRHMHVASRSPWSCSENEAPGPPPERQQGGGSRRCSGERPSVPACGTAARRLVLPTAPRRRRALAASCCRPPARGRAPRGGAVCLPPVPAA